MQNVSTETKQIAATTAAAALIGYGIWAYSRSSNQQPGEEGEQITKAGTGQSGLSQSLRSVTLERQAAVTSFVDAAQDGVKTLYKAEAIKRAGEVSDVSYRLAYALLRGGETFEGQVQVTFTLTADSAKSDSIFVDYRGEKVHSLVINDQSVAKGNPFRDHRVYFDPTYLKAGVNTAAIRFTSKYVRDCQGVQYFKDDGDGEEYLYTDHEPASCHKGFPCFDQPDLKATYTLLALVPKTWSVFSNAAQASTQTYEGTKEYSEQLKKFNINQKEFIAGFGDEPTACF